MSKLVGISINADKIAELAKEKGFQGKSGTWVNLTMSLNDDPDQYGKHASIYEEQTADERAAKTPKIFVGSGKTFWSAGSKSDGKSIDFDKL